MGHKRLSPTRLKDLFGASRNRSRTSSGSAQLGARPLLAWHDHLFKLILV
jgi:hypothetical protein